MSAFHSLRLRALPRSLSLSSSPLVARITPSSVSLLRSESAFSAARRWKSSHKQTAPVPDNEQPLSEQEEFSAFKRQRLERLEELRQDDPAQSLEAYPRLKHRQTPVSVPEFRSHYDGSEDAIGPDVDDVTVYGRVASKRQHGKYLLFLDIVNEYKTVQVMVNWKNVHKNDEMRHVRFQMFTRLLERGDHVSVTGKPIRSSTGELTINAAYMPELLTPVMQPIPTELVDADKKMERRHVDMVITPRVSDTLRMRSDIIRFIRDFLHARRFMEVQTPIMALNAGGAIARPFTTSSTEFPSKELALRVAPELWLKRLVVGGMQRVFEIGPAFRNEGIDLTHNPEFTMCEFYSAYANLDDLINLTEELVSGLAVEAHSLIKGNLKALPPIDLIYFKPSYDRLEFIPALEERMGIKFPNLSTPTALPDTLAALSLCGIAIPGEPPATIAKLLDRLAALHLEPDSFHKPLFITHHPACMSPLSKSFTCPKTGQQVSARTELFIYGREVANMYEEENNPAEQRRKMMEYREAVLSARRENAYGGSEPDDALAELDEVDEHTGEVVDQEARAAAEAQARAELLEVDPNATIDEAPPIDERYVDALEAGLPPTGGWGCGIERLVMMFSGAKRISDCLPFGTLKNVVALGVGGQSHAGGSNSSSGGRKENSRDRIDRKSKMIMRGEKA